jgi:hypothetical protein
MVHTTSPKVDKVDTSSVEAPTAQALSARLGNKVLDDAPINDDPGLLNFSTVMSWIFGWMSFLPQKYWLDPGKLDGPVFTTPDVSPASSIFSHEDVEGGFWTRSRVVSLILLPSANFWIFRPDHPWLSILSYDNLFAFGRLSLR